MFGNSHPDLGYRPSLALYGGGVAGQGDRMNDAGPMVALCVAGGDLWGVGAV